MDVAIDVLNAAGQKEGEEFVFTKALIGGAAVDAANDPYPAETEAACKASDAVLLAAIGGYKWDDLPYECVGCHRLDAIICQRASELKQRAMSGRMERPNRSCPSIKTTNTEVITVKRYRIH